MDERIQMISWFRENCIANYLLWKGKWGYYWGFNKDAENCFDGINDDRMIWFTDEEMFDKYKNNITSAW